MLIKEKFSIDLKKVWKSKSLIKQQDEDRKY